MNREGKKCVLYPRVSTEMQVDGYSLEGQKNGLKRFADREEMEIVGIYEDAGKSGKSIEGRPAFKKMLSDIKNGLEIDYILVYKLSRFGRNAADILNSLEFVQSYGINLICIEEGIDSSQTSGKLLISVLSAVAEIERENIIEQTMNGRREKARQGGWNGGFAPYGYYLKDNQLLIEETEAEAIRIIFDKFANSDIGLGGVAKYLNLQGIKKIPRQNGTLETWSSHFIRLILDNPVYCGKIAYGRRTREKVKGTKNEYKQVHAEDYILEDGQHEGIISEELWQKVHAKRMATGIKQPSKIGKDRSHLLTGILKCPLCGSSMYTNKHAWTNKDGTYKEVYYYICGRNKQERGHHCDYKASLRKTDIEPLVIEAVKELVSDKYFAKEIEKRIGVQTDTTAIDKELANYESKLKEVDLNKARLEREIDNLPIAARFRERKIHDMTLRLDGLYDTIVELEERIEDAKLRKSSIEMETITLDNIYKLMLNFGKLYDIISDEEKKSLITYLIKEIQIYPNGESEQPLKSIEFNFPIYRDGQEVRRLLWEKGNTVETKPVKPVGNKKLEKKADGRYEIEFKNVSFKYPGTDKMILKNISIKLTVGERLAIVGMNGSGKTTFIKLLCRLYDPTEGEILLDGVNIKEYDIYSYMQIFSVVFQDFKLFSFPLDQNVAADIECDEERLWDALEKAGIDQRVKKMPQKEKTSLYKDFDKDGVEISGGEAQKLALARALYRNASFIILDEPTAALDPISEYEIYERFNSFVGDRTAIYISHRLSSCRFCDKIAVFHAGQIIETGTHDELVADESTKYSELWNAQAQYYVNI